MVNSILTVAEPLRQSNYYIYIYTVEAPAVEADRSVHVLLNYITDI